MTGVSRRAFVAGGAGALAVGGAAAWRALVQERLDDASPAGVPGEPGKPGGTGEPGGTSVPGSTIPRRRRTLVVLQLGGGNDGLNTLVPAGDGRYFDARPTLGVGEGTVVALPGADHGLHPTLAPWRDLWLDDRLLAVDGVGFLEGQTRSHFQASDLWWSGLPGQVRSAGWLGRYLDRHGDPRDPLRAIGLGAPSPALIGETALVTGVRDPTTFALRTPVGTSAEALGAAFAATAEPLAADPELAAAQRSVPAALRAVELLDSVTGKDADTEAGATSAAPGSGVGTAPEGAPEGELTGLLQVAAGIIDLQIGTEIVTIGVSGYDTHANQAEVHPQLLADLGAGVSSFLERIEAQGRGDEVLVLTTSEFGRRVAENGSGTDHGNAGVQFLAGRPVTGRTIVGGPELGNQDDGAVRSSIDTRSLYAAALDWLAGDAGLTDAVLGGAFDRLGMVH